MTNEEFGEMCDKVIRELNQMKEYELSKLDFEALDKLFTQHLKTGVIDSRIEKLKDLFAKAHSATLLIEEE